eukprot:6198191-Pleurochrysis_carterae.AAC.1
MGSKKGKDVLGTGRGRHGHRRARTVYKRAAWRSTAQRVRAPFACASEYVCACVCVYELVCECTCACSGRVRACAGVFARVRACACACGRVRACTYACVHERASEMPASAPTQRSA